MDKVTNVTSFHIQHIHNFTGPLYFGIYFNDTHNGKEK